MANFNYLKQENVTATAQVTHKDHSKQNMYSVLYSYDKNISKLVIPVIVAGDQVLDFETIKRVRILLTFIHEGLQKSIEDIGVIESAENKTLSYIVTDKLKGFVGQITMNIYLDLTTDQQIDLAEYGFSMKQSVIDQNIPEIEQFYFKSLDDVIIELQQKSDEAWKGMNDSLKVVEGNLTTANNAINSLTGKADDIQKQINDQEIVSNTQLQHYLAGKEIVVTYTCDLKNKVSGSVVENPHKIIGDRGTVLPDPKTLPGDTSTAGYKKFAELDGNVVNVVATEKNEIMKIVEFFDLVTDINRRHPRLFESYGATTREQQVIAAKKIVSSVTPVTYGYGSGAIGNKLTMQIYNPRSKTWVGNSTHTEATTNKLNLAVDTYYLGDDGFVYTIVYAPPSDGATPSVMDIDYVSLEYTLKIKMSDVYATKADLYKNDQEMPLVDLLNLDRFKEYSDNKIDKLTVRRSGNVVQIQGSLTTIKEMPAGELAIFRDGQTLPSWASTRDQEITTLHQSSNTSKFMSRVTDNGLIKLGRFSDSNSTEMLPIKAGTWLPISIMYIV